MKFTIEVTCPHCGETWEENVYLRSVDEIVNGGTIDTDCLSLKCGKVIDGAKFKVVGVWNFNTCETEYKTTEEMVKLFGQPDIK